MSSKPTPVPREFLLKQIENEINAAFVFVEKARKAFKRNQPAEGEGSLNHAAKTHRHLVQQVASSPASQARALTHQLSELREAIDWLRESIVPQK